jgi:hypothetical protein
VGGSGETINAHEIHTGLAYLVPGIERRETLVAQEPAGRKKLPRMLVPLIVGNRRRCQVAHIVPALLEKPQASQLSKRCGARTGERRGQGPFGPLQIVSVSKSNPFSHQLLTRARVLSHRGPIDRGLVANR